VIKPSKIRRVLVVAYCTVWLTVPELLAGFAWPLSVAGIVSVPVSFAVDTIAVPPFRVAVPSAVVPSLNVTMPVGPPGALYTNLATNLTGLPQRQKGFGLEVTVVVEAWEFTICCTGPELAQSNSACGADE
jgi:hypothetical protein